MSSKYPFISKYPLKLVNISISGGIYVYNLLSYFVPAKVLVNPTLWAVYPPQTAANPSPPFLFHISVRALITGWWKWGPKKTLFEITILKQVSISLLMFVNVSRVQPHSYSFVITWRVNITCKVAAMNASWKQNCWKSFKLNRLNIRRWTARARVFISRLKKVILVIFNFSLPGWLGGSNAFFSCPLFFINMLLNLKNTTQNFILYTQKNFYFLIHKN